MDQGNTDPNNQNPNNPIPASPAGDIPPPPSIPSNFGIDSNATPLAPLPANFDEPVTLPGVVASPSVIEQPATPFSAPPAPVLDSETPVSGSNWANPDTSQISTPPPSSQPDPDSIGAELNPFAAAAPTPPDQNQGSSPTPFNPFSAPATESANQPLSSTPEAVPTDLSNLANTSETTSYIPQTDAVSNMGATQPESLVVTPSVFGEAPQAVSAPGGTGGFPKIFIVIGGVILLAVIAASAYFILGIGKPSTATTESIPAEQANPTPTVEIVSPTPNPSTSSASFSNLPGTTVTPTAVPTTGGSGSAYDILRRGRTSTPSANP